MCKALLAQQGLIASKGEKEMSCAKRAKSKGCIKTGVKTNAGANSQTREIVMASQLQMKERGERA